MGFPWAEAIGGVANVGSSALSAYFGWKHQKEAMKNRHQWEVEDLRKAKTITVPTTASQKTTAIKTSLKMINETGDGVNRHRASALQTNIRIEKKLRFASHCNDAFDRRIILNELS